MALHLSVLLIITGLTGVHNTVTTVSKVSVKAGGSITIPCRYDLMYRNNVKYLCQGETWRGCKYVVQTNIPHNSGEFLISDAKSQRIFIVTIKDLMNTDKYFWCIVEIDNGIDVGSRFLLSVTNGLPGLYVDNQEISGFIGESITISFNYSTAGEIQWCKMGGSCVRGPSGAIDGTSVTIDSGRLNVFHVSMSGLSTESVGWYLCIKGDLQMPVHVNVIEKPTTTTLATTGSNGDPTQHRSVCSTSIHLKSLIITLSLLIVIVLVTLFVWFMLRKHKQNKPESSAITTAEADVTYCNVKHKRKTSAKCEEEVTNSTVGFTPSDQIPCAETDMDVLYSSVVTIKQQPEKRAEAQDTDVTYSKLALTGQNT
ncbi:uncharacterized protein LOC117776020 isoform X2 [Hippoglossus hippoglossus]|uniref:uncharacterized protein LOC117776020 isoform X2 n=1 Tax=Hippoglossus hippoglossus TaxID=8267 RepID=UPI00148C2A25|nr:uncharacterized protein LOC117776020 isoform X2 [Hippoglossus hippoglossus]